MSHELLRLTSTLINEPLMITEAGAQAVFEYLFNRNTEYSAIPQNMFAGSKNKPTNVNEGKVAHLQLLGPLSHRATGLDALCGAASYQTFATQYINAINDPQVSTIVFEIDSGGGQAAGCFDFARMIREKATESGKRTVAYVDSLAASAAYALACACDEVVMSPEASVGSIGVIVAHQDISSKLEKDGIKITPIHFGKYKADGNPFEALSDESKSRIQSRVDTLGNTFVSHVASMRGIEKQAVIDTEALVYFAEDAIKLGLADKIMSPTMFNEYITNLSEEDGMALNLKTNPKGETMSIETTELESKLAELTAALAAKDEDLNLVKAALAAKADQEKANLVSSLVAKASAWEAFNVNAQDYAALATQDNVDASFVAMFDQAMESASNLLSTKEAEWATKLEASKGALEESAAMQEIGLEGEGLSPEDKELALTAQKLKSYKKS